MHAYLREVVRYTFTPEPSAFYIGWVGYENLGDEAIMAAACEAFTPINMAYLRHVPTSYLRFLVERKRNRFALLGGGTQIGPRSPLRQFTYALDRFGKGITFGTGVTPVDSVSTPKWLRDWGQALERCDYVGVRGEESAKTLAMVGVKAEVLGDSACLFAQPPGFWRPAPRKIGINIGQSGGHVFGSEEDIVVKLASLVKLLIAGDWQVELFCVWPPDLEIVKKVRDLVGVRSITIHQCYASAADYLERTRHLSVFVGVKLHSVVLAMCAGVPSLMLEYRPKCREFMNSVGMGEYTVRTDELIPEVLLERIELLAACAPQISRDILSKLNTYRNLQLERAKSLSEQLLPV